MFLNNKDAIMGLPIYLIVAIITATAVIAMLVLSMHHITIESQTYQVECELQRIISEAESMFEYADEGTLVTVHVEFPDSMKFVVFGGMPENRNAEPVDLTIDENTSNNYYFVMNDGTLSTFHSIVRFSSYNETTIALFHPGIYDLTLELQYVGGKSYVKIY